MECVEGVAVIMCKLNGRTCNTRAPLEIALIKILDDTMAIIDLAMKSEPALFPELCGVLIAAGKALDKCPRS
jgi:hypothetical protein